MTDIGLFGLLLIILNVGFSYKGFTDSRFFYRYKFEVDSILLKKQYFRLISSGFLHVSWTHLIFNMASFYAFSESLLIELGGFYFLLIYFASLVGGNLFALFIHKNHGDYSAVGASGAISGLIFAAIALFPGMRIGFMFIPILISSWLYGLLFLLISIYGIKSKRDNIGHEAHLGGALVGLITAIMIRPSALSQNLITISLFTIPTIAFIFLIILKPQILLIDNFFFKSKQNYFDIDHKYNEIKANKQKEIDNILDKISQKGLESLSEKEKLKLKEFSK